VTLENLPARGERTVKCIPYGLMRNIRHPHTSNHPARIRKEWVSRWSPPIYLHRLEKEIFDTNSNYLLADIFAFTEKLPYASRNVDSSEYELNNSAANNSEPDSDLVETTEMLTRPRLHQQPDQKPRDWELYPIAKRSTEDMKKIIPSSYNYSVSFITDPFEISQHRSNLSMNREDVPKLSNTHRKVCHGGLQSLLSNRSFMNFFDVGRVEHMLTQLRNVAQNYSPSYWPHLTFSKTKGTSTNQNVSLPQKWTKTAVWFLVYLWRRHKGFNDRSLVYNICFDRVRGYGARTLLTEHQTRRVQPEEYRYDVT
jgi:hypothetical protein